MKNFEIKIDTMLIFLAVAIIVLGICSVVKTSIEANKEIKIKQFETQVQLYGEPVSSNIEEK